MANATLSTVPSKAVQLGIFPGMRSFEELKPRLKTVIAISIEDIVTGEKFKREILLELSDAADVTPAISAAILHERTFGDVQSFCKGRNG